MCNNSHPAVRRGFTLIEVLVVVAIIALLVAILLPSLARAREQGRSAQCLSNLKQMGTAVTMYTTESKGKLPGPLHNPIYHDTYLLKNNESPTSWWYKSSLPYYIERYLGDKSKAAQLVDQVSSCPSATRPKVYPTNPNWPGAYKLPPGHYVSNTGGGPNTKHPPNVPMPYTGTKPINYFGWTNIPMQNTPEGFWNQSNDTQKKRFAAQSAKNADAIKQTGKEWMIADLWAWNASYMGGKPGPAGPWPLLKLESLTSVTTMNGQHRVPSHPYHLTLRQFDPDDRRDTNLNSERLTTGRTNTVYFDGHAEGVLRWRGTPNPCFGASENDCL